MKNEMFILGLLALTSYFMPGESHHKSRSSQFPVRKYLEDPRYPRYPRPHYSYGFIPSSPKFPKDNQWYKMCPPGTTLMLISRRSPKFLCIPKRQIISDKTKPNATTPATTTKSTTKEPTTSPKPSTSTAIPTTTKSANSTSSTTTSTTIQTTAPTFAEVFWKFFQQIFRLKK
uniref:Muc10 protein n=1 Tax=Mus musculus TaxID=10090 RepID=Q8VC95_MOUSE|nr:Muc10 protein [Mus musculus]